MANDGWFMPDSLTDTVTTGRAGGQMVENKENKVEEGTDESQAQKPEALEFEFMGKKFDLSTERGRIEAQAWSEAFGKMHGRQTNELGELRKFQKRLAPATDDREFVSKLKSLREEGSEDQIAELLLANQKNLKAEILDALRHEKSNDKAWKKYFRGRKDLLDQFEEDFIRDFSEQNLGIFDSEDPFAVLDAYWLPKVKSQKEFNAGESVAVQPTRDVSSASKQVSSKAKEPEAGEVSLDDIFGDLHKKAFSS